MKTLFSALSLVLTFSVFAQFQLRQVFAPQTNLNNYGINVDIDGSTLITADYSKDVVYIYEFENGLWELVQEIKPLDFTGNKYFGWRFSVSGSTIMVGASHDNNNFGAVYFFERSAIGVWEQKTKILSPIPSSSAYWGGLLIETNGKIATAARNNGLNSYFHVLGKKSDNTWEFTDSLTLPSGWIGSPQSHVEDSLIIVPNLYWNPANLNVYRKQTDGKWKFIEGAKPSTPITVDYFANSIAVSGKKMVVGSPKEDVIIGTDTIKQAGRIYLFEEINGLWVNTNVYHASLPKSGDDFGENVAIEGNTFVAGARYHDFSATNTDSVVNSGAVYVFEFQNNDWVETQKLTSFNRTASENFGKHLAFNNGNILIGAASKMYVFNKSADCMAETKGTAFYDVCSICVDGTSGNLPNLTRSNCVITGDVENAQSMNVLEAYPNPVNELLHLSTSANWKLFSAQGMFLSEGGGTIINMANQTNGVYLLLVEGQVIRIVK